MARTRSNVILHGLSGLIGQQVVIKQYGTKTVLSKYPDMSKVKYNKAQKAEQGLFREAVAYARGILNDPIKKKAFAKKLKKGEIVYNAAIKEYMAKAKR